MTRLSLATLGQARARRPAFDPARLGVGMAHLGVGAFHRAHQAVFTDDAIEAAGGDWGVVGLSPRRPDAALALGPQDGLFTLETRAEQPAFRILGSIRAVITAPEDPAAALAVIADPAIRVITLTVSEPAYAPPAGAEGDAPSSMPGWIVAGLARRRAKGAGPVTFVSCDNLGGNGARLEAVVLDLARRHDPDLAAWIAGEAAFPNSMVDAITPAADDALRARVAAATGLTDMAATQREPFAQWVIEDRFAAPRPAWERAGVEFVADVAGHEALKLHVLNAAHSALAYLGLARGHALVRDAIADADLARFIEAMILEEVAPFLRRPDTQAYWRATRARFAQPAMDHRLDQIARDGAAKLRERILPVILANGRAGRPVGGLIAVVRAWLAREGKTAEAALADGTLAGEAFPAGSAARAALLADTSAEALA